MIDNLLSQIAEVIGNNMWLAPLLALIAGVLTSFTPCSLSNIPLVVGYVGGIGEKDTKKAFAYSAVFSVGTAVTFDFLIWDVSSVQNRNSHVCGGRRK